MDSSNRTDKPTTADRLFVAEIVDRLGLAKAAQELGLSKLATLGIVSGRRSYSPTIRAVRDARLRIVA